MVGFKIHHAKEQPLVHREQPGQWIDLVVGLRMHIILSDAMWSETKGGWWLQGLVTPLRVLEIPQGPVATLNPS